MIGTHPAPPLASSPPIPGLHPLTRAYGRKIYVYAQIIWAPLPAAVGKMSPCSFPFPTGRTERAAEIEPINNIEAIYGRSRVKVKVEPRLTFTFTRGLSYIASILLTDVNFTCVAWKNYARVEINPIGGSTRGWRPLMWACTFCSNFLLMQKRSWQKVSPDTFDFFFVVVTLARS